MGVYFKVYGETIKMETIISILTLGYPSKVEFIDGDKFNFKFDNLRFLNKPFKKKPSKKLKSVVRDGEVFRVMLNGKVVGEYSTYIRALKERVKIELEKYGKEFVLNKSRAYPLLELEIRKKKQLKKESKMIPPW